MLVSGREPFQEANESETLTKILDARYTLPEHRGDPCRRHEIWTSLFWNYCTVYALVYIF